MTNESDRSLTLNPDVAREIIRGVNDTFFPMTGFKPLAGAMQMDPQTTPLGDISGIVNIICDGDTRGTLIVSFDQATIFFILSQLYKRPIDQINKSVCEGVGEFTNIVYGVLKTNMNRLGFKLKMSIPEVVVGATSSAQHCDGCKAMLLPFTINNLPFYVQLMVPQSS